jgi:hypothetical protein
LSLRNGDGSTLCREFSVTSPLISSASRTWRKALLYNPPFVLCLRVRSCAHSVVQYSTEGKIKEPNLFEGAQQDLMTAGMDYLRGDSSGALTSIFGLAKGAWDANKAHQITKQTRTSPADVIQWAGCKDSQTVHRLIFLTFHPTEIANELCQSADTEEAGKATGAMSYVRNNLPHSLSVWRRIRTDLGTGFHSSSDSISSTELSTTLAIYSRGDERSIYSETTIISLSS